MKSDHHVWFVIVSNADRTETGLFPCDSKMGNGESMLEWEKRVQGCEVVKEFYVDLSQLHGERTSDRVWYVAKLAAKMWWDGFDSDIDLEQKNFHFSPGLSDERLL